MCGIAGRSSRGALEPSRARLLAEAFSHAGRLRGPCGSGAHQDEEVLLVHRRLSIVDLSEAGSQPMWNEDRSVCVIVNGEIYNHAALRRRLIASGHGFRSRSDSEVIVHLYEDLGIDGCCHVIEGMFAFALWDSRTRDLYLVRDRLGIKPLAIAEHFEGVTFGSTTGTLLADPAVPCDVRGEALCSVMRWGFVPSPWSALRAARHVLPGYVLQIREGRVVEERAWWRDMPAERPSTPVEVREKIADAVRLHLIADVPVGILLSAGIDSGILAALAARGSAPRELEAWTASHRGFVEDEYCEAVRTADYLGIPLHETPLGTEGVSEAALGSVVEAMDEPLVTPSLVGLHALFRSIASKRRVVLSGDGGDELFGGYAWHLGMPVLPWWSRNVLFRALSPLFHDRSPRGPFASASAVAALARRHPGHIYIDKLRIASDEELERMGLGQAFGDPMDDRAPEIWDRFESAGVLEQMLAVDRGTALVDEMLAKVDTASMAYSVEARVPFLSDAVVDAAKGLSREHKRDGDRGKTMLREWFGELGPPGASARPKTGFNMPTGAWFEGPARGYLTEQAVVGARVLGAKAIPGNPRQRYALAMVGAWWGCLASRESARKVRPNWANDLVMTGPA
jgi:asparagine synthase (glutamine-hydrolysing)